MPQPNTYPRLVPLALFNELIASRNYDVDFIKLMCNCRVGKYSIRIPVFGNVVDLVYNHRTLRYSTSWIFQILNDYSSISVNYCMDGIHARIQIIGEQYEYMFEMTDNEVVACIMVQYNNFIGSFISQAQCCMTATSNVW